MGPGFLFDDYGVAVVVVFVIVDQCWWHCFDGVDMEVVVVEVWICCLEFMLELMWVTLHVWCGVE